MKPILTTVFCLLFVLGLTAQSDNASNSSNETATPTMGFGIGSIGFYGDLNDQEYGSPLSGNPSYNLYFIQPVTSYLDIRFSFLIGKIRQEERSLQRNINFESEIQAGAVFVEYNFDHFLPKERKIMPFVTAGLEVVSFNPKTDLKASGGEPYNYWSDGTIRDIPENSARASQAVIVQRDYSYETDIRESGYNPSSTYDESSFSIPLGIGVGMRLNDQFNFRLQSIMHLTFTDYIDGVTTKSSREFVSGKRGNGNNDHFIVNSISLTYNFQKVPGDPFKDLEEGEEEKIDYLAFGNTEDYDSDGVIDLVDECPDTRRGLDVDTLGCPVDSDGDGVPDYKDEEVHTEYPQLANHKGVELSDEMIFRSYMRYKDSTLEYAEVIERDFSRGGRRTGKYRVKVGEYQLGESPEDMSKLLSLSDLSKIDQGDRTLYTVGNYSDIKTAGKRADDLNKQGFDDTEVLSKSPSGDYLPTGKKGSAKAEESTAEKTEEGEDTEDLVVFRVQLGAFKNKPTADNFKSIPQLFVVESGGYYRFMSGSFPDFNSAAKHKVKMIVDGYKGAFVVAYKNGKRVTLKSVGVKTIDSDPIIGK